VLGFDCLRSSYGFFPHFLVEVSEQDVERKICALAEYKTYKDKYYFDPSILRSTLIRHGALAERPLQRVSISCGSWETSKRSPAE
jgi:N-acetylglucosamine malate deacetylase 1